MPACLSVYTKDIAPVRGQATSHLKLYFMKNSTKGVNVMLWMIFAILLFLWLLGLILDVAGGLIHLLLLAAAIVLIFNFIGGRRSIV